MSDSPSSIDAIGGSAAPDCEMAAKRHQRDPVWQLGTLFLAYGAFTCWWLWPLPSAMRDHLGFFGTDDKTLLLADLRFVIWVLAWGAHALTTDPSRLYRANIFHPFPDTFALGDQMLACQPLFAPTWLVTGNPILAANVAILLLHPIVAISAFALARRWVDFVPAVACGLLFAFPARNLKWIVHFPHLFAAFIPLIALFGEHWLDRGRRRDLVGLSASIVMQTLASFYLAYAAAFAIGSWLLAALVSRHRSIDRRRWAGLVAAIAAGFVPLLLTAIPLLQAKRLGLIHPYDETIPTLGLIPLLASAVVFDWIVARGVPMFAWLLAVVAVVLGRRRLGRPVAIGIAWTITGLLLAFAGPIALGSHEFWTPYRWLASIVPGLDSVRLPERFLVIATAGAALLAAIGLQLLFDRSRRMGWISTLVAGGLFLRFAASQPTLVVRSEIGPPEVAPVYRHLARVGMGGPLAEVPAVLWTEATRRMIASTVHWLPIVDGYTGYPPVGAVRIGMLVARLPDVEALDVLAGDYGVRWILVHLSELAPEARTAWTGTEPAGLRLEARFGDDLLFAVSGPPDPVRFARRTSQSTTPAGVPLTPLGSDCGGKIRASYAVPPRNTLPLGFVHLAIDLENEGPVDWPGDSLFPGHLVEGRLRTETIDGQPAAGPVLFPIGGDLKVREHRRVEAATQTNHLDPGLYTLRVELAQPLDGPLDRCGVAAAKLPLSIPSHAPPRREIPRRSLRPEGAAGATPPRQAEPLVPAPERATTTP
ncbi:MAG: hypothetical protein ACKOCT_19010 [Alphaproteobacteria bacterium]